MASNAGTATLNFGSTPIENASVVITGQTSITTGSHIEIFVQRNDSTGDNDTDAHEMLAFFGRFSAGTVVAGTGFTAYCDLLENMQATGQFTVHWVWST